MHGNGGDVGLHARVADVNFIYPKYVMISTPKTSSRATLSRATHASRVIRDSDATACQVL